MQSASRYAHPSFRLFISGLLFTALAAMLTGTGTAMFTDTDPLWHVAAGDLIRATGIPRSDPWSFTAGNYRWLNIAWGWDVVMSRLRQDHGWHGAIALNALIIAATITCIFAACLTRSGRVLPSLLATLGAVTLLSLSLRPLQVSNLMVALWLPLLGAIARKTLEPCWLIVFPGLTVLWVNTHGGFILAPLLISVFLLQAYAQKDKRLTRQFTVTLLATFLALPLNPYGIEILEAARRPLTTVANQFIREWQPFSAAQAPAYAYAFMYLVLSLFPRLPLLPAERLLALAWCALSFTANRYLSIFAIMAAPAIACALAAPMPRRTTGLSAVLMRAYDRKALAVAACMAGLAACILLPSPGAARHYRQESVAPPSMPEEIAFMAQHPQRRFLMHFNLAAIVAYETRGRIPVFVDPRTETAFPPEVLEAYLAFHTGAPGWEAMLGDYGIGGVVLPLPGSDPENDMIIRRFRAFPGWYAAFSGPAAIIFLRQ